MPSKADIARKTKKAAKFGASAVPKLSSKKATAVMSVIYTKLAVNSFSIAKGNIKPTGRRPNT